MSEQAFFPDLSVSNVYYIYIVFVGSFHLTALLAKGAPYTILIMKYLGSGLEK